jgi:hypothetical protein
MAFPLNVGSPEQELVIEYGGGSYSAYDSGALT